MSHNPQHHHQIAATATPASTSQNPRSSQFLSESSSNSNVSYRPRSPDLSAFALPPQQLQQQQRPVFHPSYQDPSSEANNSSWQQQASSGSTALTGLPGGASYSPATHRGSYDASPYFSPSGSISLGTGQSQGQVHYFVATAGAGQQQLQAQTRETVGYGSVGAGVNDSGIAGDYSSLTHSPTVASGGERFLLQHQTHAQQGFWQAPALGLTATAQEQSAQAFSASLLPQQQPKYQTQHNMPPSRRKRGQTDENDDSGDVDYAPGSANAGTAGAKTSRKRKSTSGQGWAVGRAPGDVGPSLGIDIKTKFPVARIKRIMQADEDVGKVAQATPTAVSKALELFMIALVTKAAAEAKDRSSKRVTAAHLKQAVIKDQTFDFLQEIIEKVPDPTEKKGGRAASEDVDEGAGGPAKKKRAPRGRKKAESDED